MAWGERHPKRSGYSSDNHQHFMFGLKKSGRRNVQNVCRRRRYSSTEDIKIKET